MHRGRVLLTACSSSGSKGGASPTTGEATSGGSYSVFAVESLSGPTAAYGSAAAAAVKAAVDVVNAHGGGLGKHLTLTVDDDGGDPTKAAALLQAELSKTKPNLVSRVIS